MKKTFKRILAVMTAAAIAASLSGCMDKGYIMTVDGMEIRNGVYLSLQQTSIGLANQKLDEMEEQTDESASSDISSDTTSEASEESVFDKTIDGKSYSDWIIDDTRAGVMRFVGIQRECEKLGIALSDEEVAEITANLKEQWEDTTIAYYGLGYANWGEYYESMGIGFESMKELSIVDELNEKLFLHYYDEGGEWAVSDEDFKKAADEQYAAYNLITLQYLDYKGDILITDEEKQEVKDMAYSYAERLNNEDSIIDVMYDYYLLAARNEAKKNAEESYSEEKAEGLTKEEYIEKAVSEVSVEKADDASEFDEFISKNDSVLTEELTDFVFSLATDGKAYVYEGTTSVYVVIRKPVTDLENWETYYRTDVLR
ncbi:MAG: hypothetical protein ACI4JS_11250, partial [Oscillospiraceae bacterium]